MSDDSVADEITKTLRMVNDLIDDYQRKQSRMYAGEPIVDTRGHYILTPLLQTKAQLLTAMAISKQKQPSYPISERPISCP